MLAEEEALRKVLRSSSWITEVTADVFLERITNADAFLQWGNVCAVEAMVCTLSNWDQSLLIEFRQLSFPVVLFIVPRHRCGERRQDKLADQ